jgi:hypothetical protein
MSNQTREYSYSSGDFTTESWYQEAEDARGMDYLGDGNNDNEENDGFVVSFEDQTLGEEVVGQHSVYHGGE